MTQDRAGCACRKNTGVAFLIATIAQMVGVALVLFGALFQFDR